jgi:hypothetical protein
MPHIHTSVSLVIHTPKNKESSFIFFLKQKQQEFAALTKKSRKCPGGILKKKLEKTNRKEHLDDPRPDRGHRPKRKKEKRKINKRKKKSTLTIFVHEGHRRHVSSARTGKKIKKKDCGHRWHVSSA